MFQRFCSETVFEHRILGVGDFLLQELKILFFGRITFIGQIAFNKIIVLEYACLLLLNVDRLGK